MTSYPFPEVASKRFRARWDEAVLARWQFAIPIAVFAATSLFLWALFGHRLILGTNDEGIYLDAAERIVRGQKPYLDFYGYMSPGGFWIQALVFRLLGVTLAAGRVLVIADLALECALIYWLVERFASRSAAIVTALFFLAFTIADPAMITVQHRWDSGALALASIALAATSPPRSWRTTAVSGFLIASAVVTTPSVALVALVTLVWLASPSGRRAGAVWYLAGLLAAWMLAGIALWFEGILPAFVQQMIWLARNYSAVNVMHYGSIIGGYQALFEVSSVWELPLRFYIVVCVALPALLPILALAGGAVLWIRERIAGFPYLLLCAIALIGSTYPRSDVAHLAYVAALPYAISGVVVYRLFSPGWRRWLTAAIGVGAVMFAWQPLRPGRPAALHTPVGEVRASASEATAVADLLSQVRPHSSLFVYPYKPLFYFLTQADNPTRFSYLQPGLMTGEQASLALAELKAHPPEWVLYLDLSQAEFERVFPSGKRFDAHFLELEDWIKHNYRPTGGPSLGGYNLLSRAGQ